MAHPLERKKQNGTSFRAESDYLLSKRCNADGLRATRIVENLYKLSGFCSAKDGLHVGLSI